ncbi:MAG: hypothetical protein PVI49_12495, partial [Desulfobacterales bacterium]
MNEKSYRPLTFAYAFAIHFLALLVLSCSFHSDPGKQPPAVATAGTANDSTSEIWAELLQKTPFPHTAPLPPQVP